jgi:DNA modification methylase
MAITDQQITDKYAIYNGDCIEVMADMPDNSIHMSIYSPPFATSTGGLYTYSSNERDLSNCNTYEQFFNHYDFVVREISRLTMPGRYTCVHCTDIPVGNTGKQDYLMDFPGDIIRLHEKNGFRFKARHTIWKEPLWVRNRTMTKNLAHKTIVDDSAHAGVASADYLLVFFKKGENQIPIAHPTGFDIYAGECPIPGELWEYRNFNGDQKQNRFSHWIWRRYASSIWDDINMGRVLPYQDCKEPDDEKHVHPLQLDVIERAIVMRSNPGENILTPFMGVGSEVYVSVELGRRGIGAELKPSYYRQAVKNVSMAKSGSRNTPQGSLLDFCNPAKSENVA